MLIKNKCTMCDGEMLVSDKNKMPICKHCKAEYRKEKYND